jgi:hypothetical protein
MSEEEKRSKEEIFGGGLSLDGTEIKLSEDERERREKLSERYSPNTLSIKHKRCIMYVADGLSRSEAYMRVYPNCSSKATARVSMSKIFYNPEAVEYYNSLVKERRDYIEQDKRLSLNDISSNLVFGINESKKIIQETRDGKIGDRLNAVKSLFLGIEKYSTIVGVGNYDMNNKLKVFEEQERIKGDLKTLLKEEELKKLNGIIDIADGEVVDVTEDMLDNAIK